MIVIHSNVFFCLVSEIKMLYCQLDMTSSSVLRHYRQGTLHPLFLNGFWKSDHDFPLCIRFIHDVLHVNIYLHLHLRLHLQFMIHINILATMHCFQDNKVVLPTGYDVIVSPFYLQCMVSEITMFFASRIWRRDLSARGRFTLFYMTDSERATMTSW